MKLSVGSAAAFELNGRPDQAHAALEKELGLTGPTEDLMVRMAGYSDYFNDMNEDLQQEVIDRTQNESF